jgi:hypothetical protein
MTDHDYTMTISLNVLNHLGLNLYSNVPSVLSEVVANSYDADAEIVRVTIDPDARTVTILDDGHGMTRKDVNERFLNVGFQRREKDEGAVTPLHGRKVMGRKGIGKLSLFSIANTVEVYTAKDGEKSALRMSVPAIKAALADEKVKLTEEGGQAGATDSTPTGYHPEPLDTASIDFEHGTRIVLKDLKKGIARSGEALRTRLARRFSILGAKEKFQLYVGGTEVTVADRGYFHKLQYVWTYDDEPAASELIDRCTNAEHKGVRGVQRVPIYVGGGAEDGAGIPEQSSGTTGSGDVAADTSPLAELEIRGWIGTGITAGSLKEPTTGDDLNQISLIVRGKLAHEDLLQGLNENGIYASYLIGEIHADQLDLDDHQDIATSSRQRIDEDDPRFKALQTWLRGEITRIGNTWTDLRNDKGVATALDNPLIKEWFATLHGDTKKKAVSLFGKINQLTIDNPSEKADLFAQAVLGFETLRYRDNLDALDKLQPGDIKAATSLFQDVTEIQAALYHQIVQQRIEVIEKLDENLEDNVLEKVLQDHLYDNLWLLDPGWERATDRAKEEHMGKAFSGLKLSEDEEKGRMDIRYKRTGGMNVIVELKRRNVLLSDFEIMAQVEKYQQVVTKYLQSTGSAEGVEVVVVVGRDLRNWETTPQRNSSMQSLASKGIRVVQYDKLLADARAGYREYLDAQHDLGRIQQILMGLAEPISADVTPPANGTDPSLTTE